MTDAALDLCDTFLTRDHAIRLMFGAVGEVSERPYGGRLNRTKRQTTIDVGRLLGLRVRE